MNLYKIKMLRAKYKSIPDAPKVKESYFATCERDDEGHCLPSGQSGDNEKKENTPLRIRPWSKNEMIARGADGHLSIGYERFIPISKITGKEPTPSSAEDKPYKKGQEIKQPIEVSYNSTDDTYTLYAGNHRVTQAELNGQKYIIAFVEPDGKNVGPSASRINKDQ